MSVAGAGAAVKEIVAMEFDMATGGARVAAMPDGDVMVAVGLLKGVVPARVRTVAIGVGVRTPIVTVPLVVGAIPAMRFRLGERTCRALPLTSG